MRTPTTSTSRTGTIPTLIHPPTNPSTSPPDPPIPRASRRKATSSSEGDSLCTSTAPWARRNIRQAKISPMAASGWTNTPKNVESVAFLWRHKNWDIGLTEKRVGTLYNDNGSLTYLIGGIKIPYPVDQAITINPFNMLNVYVNYTIKNQSWLRGSKLGLAVNNLADSHNVVGVTPSPSRRIQATS